MTHDTALLSRALRGLNALIDQTPVDDLAIYDQGQLVFQPYNLAAMIKASSTLTKVSCGWTYRSLFGHTLNFHDLLIIPHLERSISDLVRHLGSARPA